VVAWARGFGCLRRCGSSRLTHGSVAHRLRPRLAGDGRRAHVSRTRSRASIGGRGRDVSRHVLARLGVCGVDLPLVALGLGRTGTFGHVAGGSAAPGLGLLARSRRGRGCRLRHGHGGSWTGRLRGRRRWLGLRGRSGRRRGWRRRSRGRCRRGRGRRDGHGWGRARREEGEGVDVSLRFGREPDPEVDVRLGVLGRPASTEEADGRTLDDRGATTNRDAPEVEERDRVAVLGLDRHGTAAARDGPGERDGSARGCANRLAVVAPDVDPAVVSGGVGVVTEAKRL
jgi:hypothetical protein